MPEQQTNQTPPESEAEKATPEAPGGYQTPIESNIRTTGVAEQTDAKPTTVPESGSSDQLTEGAGNQGTEKR